MVRSFGFTLIELMITVAIIAILTAIAMPMYQTYVIRAQVTEGVSLTDGARIAIIDYYVNHGQMPATNADVGLTSPSSAGGRYVGNLDISTGVIRATFNGPDVHPALKNQVFALAPVSNGGDIYWTCGGGGTTIEPRYLPASCQQ